MSSSVLYAYSSISEVKAIAVDRSIYSFVFQETKELLERNPNIVLDITSLIYYLQANPRDSLPAYVNLKEMTDETLVVVKSELADEALEIFYMLFESVKFLTAIEEKTDNASIQTGINPIKRKSLYVYSGNQDVEKLILYTTSHEIPLITFSQAAEDKLNKLEFYYQVKPMVLIDFTSICYALENNKSNLYTIEVFLNHYRNAVVIIQSDLAQTMIDYLPLYFEKKEAVFNILPGIELTENAEDTDNEVKTVTSFSLDEIDELEVYFNSNLVGHPRFKEELFSHIRNFHILNKIGEQRVLSVFLFGKSGIGKTEVARTLANGFIEDSYLVKINFQNYSSKDALNSLIGSPAGYIGCDQGEFSSKIEKSKIGIILLDEFEKTTSQVWNFFLELLEEGKFTDSMAREHDLDGYILVFTSNIPNKNSYKSIIPNELQTRFDLVCEFEPPTIHDKKAFVDLLVARAKKMLTKRYPELGFSDQEVLQLSSFNYADSEALRDIKKIFNQKLASLISAKKIQAEGEDNF